VKLGCARCQKKCATDDSSGSPAPLSSDRLLKGLCAGSSRFHDLLTSVKEGPAIKGLTRTVGHECARKAFGQSVEPGLRRGVGDDVGVGRSDPAV